MNSKEMNSKNDPSPAPCLAPLMDDKKRYQIVKQTNIPQQFFITEDDVVATKLIAFVFIQEVNAPGRSAAID